MIRQPIVAIMGHVDHGKTLLQDKIRGSAIAAREAGGITQAIGASIIPLPTIQKICGSLLEALKLKLTIPGLLFIDTPGHAAFTNLRRRGGNLADIAVLVINVMEGFMPQTLECIEILKHYKTPFVIAANKIDLLPRWRPAAQKPLLQNIAEQEPEAQKALDIKVYEIIGKIYELGFEAERYDRVSDFTKQIAVVPTSAVTGEGIPELLVMLTGLAQRFLESGLKVTEGGPAQGTVIEVKEDKGLGKTMDVILYDGSLKVGDAIVIGGLEGPIVSRVKALFTPAPLQELREKKTKFTSTKEVVAATGVKIVAPDTENVVSGMPIIGNPANVEEAKAKVQQEVEKVIIETGKEGVIIKADSLGSLEALITLLKDAKIPVMRAGIGPVTKKDITDAAANVEKDPLLGVVLGFNIPQPEGVPETVSVLTNTVIYRLIEDYQKWAEHKKKAIELAELDLLIRPCKIEILKGYVFRQSNPAVCGIHVIAGTIKTGTPLMTMEGRELTVVKGLQEEQENIEKAEKGKQVAVSLPNVIIGRQLHEGDILISAIPEEHFRKFKEYKEYLTNDEKELLKEIAQIMRKNNPVWGV
ncbi:MAG: translation initiation factor IF-2 [Candidatus Woesearchaeota archaeon]